MLDYNMDYMMDAIFYATFRCLAHVSRRQGMARQPDIDRHRQNGDGGCIRRQHDTACIYYISIN